MKKIPKLEYTAEFKESRGSPRMFGELRARGYPASKERVERLMQKNGIKARHKRRLKITTGSKHNLPVAPNLLQLHAERAGSGLDIRHHLPVGGRELAVLGHRARPVQPRNGRLVAQTADWLPRSSTRVGLNGTELGRVPGEDFYRALLSIWIGKHPVSDDLKKGLLGG